MRRALTSAWGRNWPMSWRRAAVIVASSAPVRQLDRIGPSRGREGVPDWRAESAAWRECSCEIISSGSGQGGRATHELRDALADVARLSLPEYAVRMARDSGLGSAHASRRSKSSATTLSAVVALFVPLLRVSAIASLPMRHQCMSWSPPMKR